MSTPTEALNKIINNCKSINEGRGGLDNAITMIQKIAEEALHPSESAGVKTPDTAVYELKIVLHRLLKSFKGIAVSEMDKKRCEDAERILNKYSSIKDVLRSETSAAGASVVWVNSEKAPPLKEGIYYVEFHDGKKNAEQFYNTSRSKKWWKRYVKRWLDESPSLSPDQSGKEDAVAFDKFLFQYCKRVSWDTGKNEYNWVLNDEVYTTSQLYDIYKNPNK